MDEAQAWAKLRDDLEEVRQIILGEPLTHHNAQTRAEAMSLVHQAQASAWSMVIAPRQDLPRFFGHAYYEPNIYNWNLPNPDFLYKVAFVDGARRYRITGQRNTGHWCDIQSLTGQLGEPNPGHNGNYDLDDFAIGDGGAFDIVVSAEPQPGNWIRISPDSRNNQLLVRRLVYDWETEVPPSFAIEPIDGRRGVMNFDEAELARRIALAGDHIKYVVREMNLKGIRRLAQLEDNQFLLIGGEALKTTNANPAAVYGQARYAFEPDEALIVESEVPDCTYWGIHLGDIWNQTRDFIDHMSSLNGRQAHLDSDGRFRAVIALDDPGVPNWLDPVGTTYGRVVSRWYAAASAPATTMRKVKAREVRDALPADTPRVSPEERRALVRRRRDAMLRQWGY